MIKTLRMIKRDLVKVIRSVGDIGGCGCDKCHYCKDEISYISDRISNTISMINSLLRKT